MSVSLTTASSPARLPSRRNVLTLARPYFGLIVLVTILLTVAGVVADAAHAQRHLSRGGLSADRR